MAAPAPSERTFHRDANSKYVLPNDRPEHTRLDGQFHYMRVAMNGNVRHAPVKHPGRILDVGCGTGVATDILAQEFPDAEVFGVDLSLVPARPGRPTNVHFLKGNTMTDAPTTWVPNEASAAPKILQDTDVFDLIFARMLILAVTDWSKYVATIYAQLRPGGWAEIQELDIVWRDANGHDVCANSDWMKAFNDVCRLRGFEVHAGRLAQDRMKRAGFVDVTVYEYPFPAGAQPGSTPEMAEAGEYMVHNLTQVAEVVLQSGAAHGFSAEEIQRLQEEAARDLASMVDIHAEFCVTVGRKPH